MCAKWAGHFLAWVETGWVRLGCPTNTSLFIFMKIINVFFMITETIHDYNSNLNL